MLNPKSIHFRLVLWYSSLTVAASVAFGAFIYENVRKNIYGEVANIFTARCKNIAENILPHVRDKTPEQIAAQIEQVFYPEAANRFIQILKPDGSTFYLSGPPKDGHFDPVKIAATGNGADAERIIDLAPDLSMFIISFPAAVDGKPYMIEMGGETDIMEATLDSLTSTLLYCVPVLVLVLSAGGLVLVRRSLKPVDDIRRSAAEITFGNLSNRLPVSHTGDSLEHLSLTLNQMLTRLDDSYQLVSRFAADAAHELRTPLAIMRGELESVVGEKKLPGNIRDRIGSVLEESERLTRITDSLLAISRMDAGESKVADERFDLSALAKDTAEQMSLLADEKNIRLDITSSGGTPVCGDSGRIKEVVVNLLDNAIKYTPKGGRVVLSVFAEENNAVLEVRDNGIGIPAKSLPLVFDRFYRVDKSRSRSEGGTGLGLAIARSICLAHGGSIGIDSTEGKGTVCRVELPLAPAA